MKGKAWLGFEISRDNDLPLYEQICNALRQQAIRGDLPPQTRLPPTRSLAVELGVSRSTVINAYEQLVAEGYLTSLPGSGYSLSGAGGVELLPPSHQDNQHKSKTAAALDTEADESLNVARPPYGASLPDMDLFPHKPWARTVAQICRRDPRSLTINTDPRGNPELRAAIARHLADWRGIQTTPSRIFITAGAIDALELCLRTLCRQGDPIALENPGYLPLRQFVQSLGLAPSYLPLDAQGTTLPNPNNHSRIAVLTPSHQYPMGGTMSPERRSRFIQWAQAHQGWLIEDDYDSEFRFAGRPIPALAGFDPHRTLYIGSFSKILSSNLRLGYLAVPDELIEPCLQTLSRFGSKASLMPQRPLAEFIDNGEFYRHLRRMRRIYNERRQYLIGRLSTEFNRYGTVLDHQAGMQLVFVLNPPFDDQQLAEQLQQQGMMLTALSSYYAGKAEQRGLIFGYSGLDIDGLGLQLDALQLLLRPG
ncbi:PLP-dependent aminotransferase family protein [Motiliproteus sp.]|uniref:MocR-like pyridoxine biosynthesis transcription factor PdxR n=1 Tax=Motiliproteus sp. TaxID=1898955 RepID=UPI003BAD0E72